MTTAIHEHVAKYKSVYDEHGWFRFPYRFTGDSVALLRERVASISAQSRPEVVHEKGGNAVRAIHGCHDFDEACAALVHCSALVSLATALIGAPAAYVYQFKVNLKPAREGAAWPWHQDFAFWSEEDGMPRPDAVNIAISLDEMHEGNGPMILIPGTHRLGLFDLPPKKSHGSEEDWRSHVAADLAYTVNADRAETLARKHGKRLVLGRTGSIHVFHPSIIHSSSDNLSADGRALLLITYNAVGNAPTRTTRPSFLVSRNCDPLVPVDDERFRLEPDTLD
ncbi:ectoine hydroxylase [Catenulispora sp. GAS73]|uniref:phytanoyl-CoA dioxygenase family protein n=1 Tax=Catenulispora sp. GAS73 TaxID=3156269 RepID=UPI003513648E